MCPVCRGRGEVEAGITHGTVEYGPVYDGFDFRGNTIKLKASFPTKVSVNPAAWDSAAKTVWMLEKNLFGSPWGLAICVMCHGTGMSSQGDKKCPTLERKTLN